MNAMSPRSYGPPPTVVAACVLIGVACVVFYVVMLRDGGTDEVSGVEWVIGSTIICAAVGGSLVYKLLRRARGIARFVMVIAGVQVLAAPAEWYYQHSVSVDGVVRALVGGGIAVLLALPPSRAWFALALEAPA
ncbi:hypothetical protein ACQPZJ_30445 [Actinoplanes sp. CA-054009]